ncbi:hypothetical protein DM02DRAFT_621008 [Periconia macrospinosa]|uniref:MADS-box domain-containing protein n=1 Tax=Periconia macrospinosa TaxID=97972 RepID=A0A2V1CYA3_9PLEO|nr:hypothetical protein DM02DRAFT_621008 [Periconia macrospinosa]
MTKEDADTRFFNRRRDGINKKAKDLVLQNQNVRALILYAHRNELFMFRTHPHLNWPLSDSAMQELGDRCVEERNMDNYPLTQAQQDRMPIWRRREGLLSWGNHQSTHNTVVNQENDGGNDALSRVISENHAAANSPESLPSQQINGRIDNNLDALHTPRPASMPMGNLQTNTRQQVVVGNMGTPSQVVRPEGNNTPVYIQDTAFDSLNMAPFPNNGDEVFDPWTLSPTMVAAQTQTTLRPSPKTTVKEEPISDDEEEVTDEDYFNPGDMPTVTPPLPQARDSPKRRRTDSNVYEDPRSLINSSSADLRGFTPINRGGVRQTQSHPTLRVQPNFQPSEGRTASFKQSPGAYSSGTMYNLRRNRFQRGG